METETEVVAVKPKIRRASPAEKKAKREAAGLTIRRYNLRLYPTLHQEELLHKYRLTICGIYNLAMRFRLEYRKKAEYQHVAGLRRTNPKYMGLSATVCRDVLKRVDQAFDSYFRALKSPQKGKKINKPCTRMEDEFQGWDSLQPGTFGVHLIGPSAYRVKIASEGFDLGIGEVRARGSIPMQGRYKTLTITYDRPRRAWYASVTVEGLPRSRTTGDKAVGVDLGLKELITCVDEDGGVLEIPNLCKPEKDLRKKLYVLERRLQRQGKRDKNGRLLERTRGYDETSLEKAKIWAKIANVRRDYQHKVTTNIVASARLIATEQLSVKNMMAKGGARKKGLNKSFGESGLAALRSKLEYKAKEGGIPFVEVPTKIVKPTQTCSVCGHQEKKSLAVRKFTCVSCGTEHGRDINAATVMLNWAASNVVAPING